MNVFGVSTELDRKKKASFLTFLIKNVNVCFQCNRHLLSNQISHTEAFIRTRFTATQNRKPMNNFCIVFETSWGSESVCLSLSVCKRHLKGVSASTTGSGVALQNVSWAKCRDLCSLSHTNGCQSCMHDFFLSVSPPQCSCICVFLFLLIAHKL